MCLNMDPTYTAIKLEKVSSISAVHFIYYSQLHVPSVEGN
jgi:hypothetical protein